ncbi:nucleotide exchange factor GrpE [Paenibacillus sp. TAB 01]|uniref:nucleotide exchange factor GrpE n=1 Tax=Paenibacillus sp. TAB 01 TaxID=3368988 RepID=UPI003751B579
MSTEQKNQANTEQEVDATYNENAEAEAADAGQDESNAQEQAGLTPEQQEIEKLKLQADEHHQRLLRAQADFDNFRRRTRQEKEEFAKYASLKVVEQLLPVVDNFERALAAGKDSNDYDALIKGVDMIFRQLDQVLAAEGLTRMETVGQPFNPEFHQAVMQVESDEHEEGIVVEELQKGYLLKDKVLRPAMVKVSS